MPILIVFGVGAVAGFFVGKGTDQLASIVKWGAVAGGVYVAGKALKVI